MTSVFSKIKQYLCGKPPLNQCGRGSNIFHIALHTLFKQHGGEPIFLQLSLDYLLQNACHETRIFRDKPDMSEYEEFVTLCESSEIHLLQPNNRPSALVVAWFLRMFLFHLPDPLITPQYQLSHRLLAAIDIKLPHVFKQPHGHIQNHADDPPNADVDAQGTLDNLMYIKSLIVALDTEHFQVLRKVIHLFDAICTHQIQDNHANISAHHLSQIFGPILIGQKLANAIGLKHKLNANDAKTLDLSQDLCFFLITHYRDIFERNTFKELTFLNKRNALLEQIHSRENETFLALQSLAADRLTRLSDHERNVRLRARLFLAWRAQTPRSKFQQVHFAKLQQLRDSLDAAEKMIQKQARIIKQLNTKMELGAFDQKTGASLIPMLGITAGSEKRTSHFTKGKSAELSTSIRQILRTREFDRQLTRDMSSKSLFDPGRGSFDIAR